MATPAIERGFSCLTCVFYSAHRPHFSEQASTRGQCRRHAPVIDRREDGSLRSAWPMVSEWAFCGDHAVLAEPEDEADEGAAGMRPTGPPIRVPVEVAKPVRSWRCGNCAGIWHSDDKPAKCTACQCRELSEIA